MIRSYGAVRTAASAIARAARTTMGAYAEGRVVDEPNITDRLIGSIETEIKGSMAHGVMLPYGRGMRLRLKWEAMTVRAGSGLAAHEKKFGADILGVFTVDIPDYRIAKGFLAQAKRAEPRGEFKREEWRRLQDQCTKMLDITPDAYVLVYSKNAGIRLFSASAVVAYSGRDIFSLYGIGIQSFFEKHFESFIGDLRLNRPDIATLENLHVEEPVDSRPSAHLLHLKVSQVW